MKKKYCEKHEACNAISAPPSSRSGYERFHNILGGTPKLTSAVGGIDHGFHLPDPQVVNLDDHLNSIPKTQPPESFKCQTLIFVDNNDHVTQNHTFNQAFDIVSPKTKACNLIGIRGKPNKKAISKKRCLSK
jgi:hypothetical protein